MSFVSSVSSFLRRTLPTFKPTTQTRTFYQERLRRRFNKQTQQMEYEDAANLARRFYEDRHKNHSIRAMKYNFYEKPWMKKQRKIEGKIYKRKETQVTELIKYIQFIKDAKVKGQR